MVNPYINTLNKRLAEGRLTQNAYGRLIKTYYDGNDGMLDKETTDFLETKLTEMELPLSSPSTSDGIVKQAVSGLLEGFTTFGFADTPDTPTEKIVNNVSHLIGLAPGVMLGGGRMLGGAAKTVGNALIRRGGLEKNKKLVDLGNKLKDKSRNLKKSNDALTRGVGRLAGSASFVDKNNKLVFGLRSGKPTMVDPRNGKAIYELKSIPGKIAEVIQQQGLSYLGDNKAKGMTFITQGLLRNKFSEEGVARILHEAGHVGLLMAFSNQPLATRNEDGIKGMAMAGMHGAIAGGIFGSIGQYANVSKLVNSTNPALVQAGKNVVRKTAKSLVTRNDMEATQFVNTMVRATAGAGYGLGTSLLHDLPVEEQIYETLMGVFFSVNGRPTYENRATKDINRHANIFEMTKTKEENLANLKSQKWFQKETSEYKQYWENHIDSIMKQQLESVINITPQAQQALLKTIKQADKDGLLDKSVIKNIMEGRSDAEGTVAVIQELIGINKRISDPNYNEKRNIESYNTNDFIDLSLLNNVKNFKNEQTTGNESDFPVHSLTEIGNKIQEIAAIKGQNPISKETFHLDVNSLYKKTKKEASYVDRKGEKRVDVDVFVQKFVDKYGLGKKGTLSETEMGYIRKVALNFEFNSPVKDHYLINMVPGEGLSRKDMKRPSMMITAKNVDPKGNPISKLTSGRRDNFENFDNMKVKVIDNMEVKTGEGNVYVKPNDRIVDFAQGEGKARIAVSDKQWYNFEKELNKKNEFIYGGIADTGRIEVRTYPWGSEGKKGHIPLTGEKKSVAALYNIIKTVYEKVDPIAKQFINSAEYKKDINSKVRENAVATMIYRMKDFGLITEQKNITYANIRKLIPKYINMERGVYGPRSAAKSQKYLNLFDKDEIPFLPGEKLGLKSNDMRGIVLKDLNNNSETDGTIKLSPEVFDIIIKYMGDSSKAINAKGSLNSPSNSKRGLVLGKFAYVRADEVDAKYMKDNDLQFMIYESGAKSHINIRPLELNRDAYDKSLKIRDQKGIYPDLKNDLGVFTVKSDHFHWNTSVYEKVNQNGKLNIMQQMYLNMNGIQFDRNTEVGRKAHKAWSKLLFDNVMGDPKVNKEVESRIKGNKNQSLKGLDIDKISLKLVDDIMTAKTRKKAYKDIAKHFYFENKHGQFLDTETSSMQEITSKHFGQHWASSGFEASALQSRGGSAFLQKTLRNYAMTRMVRPEVSNSYSTILGSYDWKISLKKQKYSEAEAGLADNEFMLAEGAADIMRIQDPVTGKEIKLGTWWKTMSKILDRKMYNDNRLHPTLDKFSAEQLNDWLDSQYSLINRSPVMTAGDMRALKFVGFVRGQSKKGMSLYTNAKNDEMMGGADKDIDSAHLSWGMPKDIVKGFRQEHVQYEMSKDMTKNTENYDIKDDNFIKDVVDMQLADKNPFGILLLGQKQSAARAARYGKTSIGVIFNEFTRIKTAVDLALRERNDISMKDKRLIYQDVVRLNKSIGNRYIDAMETKSIDDAFSVMTKVKDKIKNKYKIDISKYEKTIQDYHSATIKQDLKGSSYEVVSNKMLELQGGVESYMKEMASYTKDLNLTIDPLYGYSKDNVFQLVRNANRFLANDPYAQAFGIQNEKMFDNVFFNERGMTQSEIDVIKNNTHFLYNKMHVFRVVKAVQETNKFITDVKSEFDNYLGMNVKQLDSFVRELIHVAQQQKFMHSGEPLAAIKKYKSDSRNNANQMSYPEVVFTSKEMLKKELERIYTQGTRGELPPKVQQKINKRVVELFEYWHEANPFMELDFNTMTGAQKKFMEQRKNLMIGVSNKLTNLKQYYKGNTKGNPRPNNWKSRNDINLWSKDDRRLHNKLRSQLSALEYEARRFAPEGPDNMMRNAAISEKVKTDIAKFETKVLGALNPVEPLARDKKFYKMIGEPEPTNHTDVDGPGRLIDNHVKNTGKFTNDLIPWETLSKVDNISKEIDKTLLPLNKQIEKYKMSSNEAQRQLDRFSDIIYTMIKNGNTPNVIELSSIYLKAFQQLDVVSKSGITEIDYTHLRVFNNFLQNMYTDTWVEYATRNSLHKKYVKEIEGIEKITGKKLMPPSWVTDLQFPSQQAKVMQKVEKAAFKIEAIATKKNGKFVEEGIKYPTATVELMAESVGKAHQAGEALYKALETEFNGKLDVIRTTEQKELYNKYKSTIEAVASYERQMGLKGDEAPNNQGPRPTEHPISIENLTKNVIESRKKLANIPKDVTFKIKQRGTDRTFEATPRDLVEWIKDNIQTESMTEAYKLLHESNYKEISKMLTPSRLKQMGMAKEGILDFNKFYNPKEKPVPGDSHFSNKVLSETLLNKHGIIVPERLKFIEDINLMDKNLHEGKNTVRKHLHTDDMKWAEYQLDLLDIVEGKYGSVLPNGNYGLNYKDLAKKKNKKTKKTLLFEMTEFVKNSNRDKINEMKTGFQGTQEIDGTRFSNLYHPLGGQDATKQKAERIQKEHVPQEALRYFGELVNKKTGEIYTEYKDIPIKDYLNGDISGRYNSKTGIKKNQIRLENPDLYEQIESGFKTEKEAAEILYDNMTEKLLNNPERFNNPMYDEVAENRVNNLAKRSNKKEKVGGGVAVNARSKAAIPVEGYDVSLNAYRKYLKSGALGVTNQRASLAIRLYLRNFKNGTIIGNKNIDPDVGRAWHHKLVDIARGYMNMPSVRNFELYGVTEKDMNMLKDYAETGYSIHYTPKDIVDKKLINDFKMFTRPNKAEERSMQKELLAKYKVEDKKLSHKIGLDKISNSKTIKNKAKLVAKKKASHTRMMNKTKQQMRDDLYGKFYDLEGTLIPRNSILFIDYAENQIIKKSGKGRFEITLEYDTSKSKLGMLRNKTNEYRDDFIYSRNPETGEINTNIINKRNIDITHMRKSFRSFYSEETVGNVMLKLEQRANKLLGKLTNNKIQMFKDLPKDPASRHKAMVAKLNWISDMEGKFEMMALLAHPKSAMANAYGGTTNLITDVGFDYYLKSLDEAYLVNDVFKGKTYKLYDSKLRKFIDEPIKTKGDVHMYFEQRGFLDSNIQNELVQMKPPGDTDWKAFSNEAGKILGRKFKKLPIYTKDSEVNKKNKAERDKEVKLTLFEAGTEFGINKKMVEYGASFMRVTERHLRMKTAIAHYVKAKDLFTDSRGNVEVNEKFLLDYAQKGIEATQFIYHATNRPGFSNTSFGRMMTRFHPYSWNSIRRRANIISDYMITEGYGDFEANRRFENQMSADLMVSALGSVFAASIFEYALSPPMNWAVDFSHLMFGDQKERERAFYNQYGHPLLAPLGIVTPPAGRFVLSPMTALINNDWEPFWKYTAATALPFGRVGRDLLRTADTLPMFGEFMFGIPIHAIGRLGNKPEKEPEEGETTE